MFAVLSLQNVAALGGLGLLGLVVLVVAIWMSVGLFQARSLIRRELAAYFFSPIAYVVLVVFLVVTGGLFFLTMEQLTAKGAKGVEYPMQFLLGNRGNTWGFWLIFLVIPPLLTMRLLAEERGSGTLELLMTAPLRDWQVVLAKYLACFAFYLFLWLPTLVYLPILLDLHIADWNFVVTPYSILLASGVATLILGLLLLIPRFGTWSRVVSLLLLLVGLACVGLGGWAHYRFDTEHLLDITTGANLDPMPVVSSYLGLALAGAMFLAIGLLVSSFVRSQLLAALVSLVLSLGFVFAAFWLPDLDPGSALYRALFFFSVPLHFDKGFTVGLVSTQPLVLYSTVTLFCLFLTVRSLERRRWS